jgi:hypothetical protein
MKLPYNTQQIERAINCFYRNNAWGLCSCFNDTFSKSLPPFLKALGGRSKQEWFWLEPYYWYWNSEEEKKAKQARAQRATMLAFMLAWSKDRDFEV